MRSHRALGGALRLLGLTRESGRWARVLLILVGLTALLVQAWHPALHPLEVIDSGVDRHQTCPLSHAVAGLLTALSLLICAILILGYAQEPRPWRSHPCFIHCLAPRPPPL